MPQKIAIECVGTLGCNSTVFRSQLAAGVSLVADVPIEGTLRGLQQIAHAPDVIGDPSSHRGSHAQRFVDAAKIVKSEPGRDSAQWFSHFLLKALVRRVKRQPTGVKVA